MCACVKQAVSEMLSMHDDIIKLSACPPNHVSYVSLRLFANLPERKLDRVC